MRIGQWLDTKAMERMLWLLHQEIRSRTKSDEDMLVEARLWELVGESELGRIFRLAIEQRIHCSNCGLPIEDPLGRGWYHCVSLSSRCEGGLSAVATP